MAQKLDLVIVGATGFTGKLAALYCAETYGSKIKWGIAGRDAKRLEALREEVETATHLEKDTIRVIVADNMDPAAVAAMVNNTKVVVSFAGPFWKFGSILVEQCVKAGVHYCDITGESPWIREMIDQLHEAAKKSGAKIIPFCGLDSVPSDLGCYLVAAEMRRRFNCDCKDVTLYVGPNKGGVSGGTIASMFNLFDRPWPVVRKLLAEMSNPYYLAPGATGPNDSSQRGVWYSADSRMITAPWIMARANGHVVHRSNFLLGNKYGANMKYGEAMAFTLSVKGFLTAVVITVVLLVFSLAVLFKPLRGLLLKVLPAPGEGPSAETRKTGFFRWWMIGHGDKGAQVRANIEGDVDPGYTGAARMAIESAMCLVQQGKDLPKEGGVLTPASILNETLLKRLNGAGIKFEIAAADGDRKTN